jgi:hypothetical protein
MAKTARIFEKDKFSLSFFYHTSPDFSPPDRITGLISVLSYVNGLWSSVVVLS